MQGPGQQGAGAYTRCCPTAGAENQTEPSRTGGANVNPARIRCTAKPGAAAWVTSHGTRKSNLGHLCCLGSGGLFATPHGRAWTRRHFRFQERTGKTALAGHILRRCMTPGDPLHKAGAEYLLLAGSVDQARLTFRFIRPALEATGAYRFVDSMRALGITHKATGTRLRVLSSNGKKRNGHSGLSAVRVR